MGDNMNIISSCSSIVDFNDAVRGMEERLRDFNEAIRRMEERLGALQLQPLQANLHPLHHGDHGFINNPPTLEEINSAIGGFFTHHEYYRMRQRASVEAALPRLHTDNYSKNCPWRALDVVSMAMDQCECQYLHAVIDEGNPTYVALILSEVKDHLHELMTHRFGSSLIQKFFEARRSITWQQMDFIVYLILSNDRKLRDVCTDDHGTRVMQIMLENIRHPFTTYVVLYMMKGITIPLMKNVNGSNVIVQCVKLFQTKHKKIIFDQVERNCVDIATDVIGFSVVIRCLEHGGRPAIDSLVAKIISNVIVLAEDSYGNNVVQYVIQKEIPLAKEQMIQEFRNKFDRLSVNKHGSKVVENLLRLSKQNDVEVIVEEIMRSCNFLNVLQDPYGNFVAQRALNCTQGRTLRKLCCLIRSHRLALQSHIDGRIVFEMAMAYSEGSEFDV